MTTNHFINHRVLWLLIPLLTLFNLSARGTTGTLTLSSDNKFGTSSGSTKNDDQGNTWTCTCSNIQNSYQTTYSGQQFGTGKSPADATFTCTIAGATISSVKATMATGEGGTYTIKVGGDTKYSGSLTTTATEYGGTSATGTGEIEIKITKGTKASYLGQIIVVYSTTPASKYTVSFSTGTGNPSVDAREEASAGSGITLPSVTPACSSDGWALYGWATSAVGSSTTTAPTIVGKAGDTYKPSDDITLYAVYAKGEYTKITSVDAIDDGGKYIIAAYYNEKHYVMTNDVIEVSSEDYLKGKIINETTTNKYHAAAINAAWVCTFTKTSTKFYIQNASGGYIDTYYDSSDWYNHTPQDTYDKYTITYSSGSFSIVNSYGSYPNLDFFSDETFGPNGTSYGLLLYEQTSTPYYYSSPTCVTCGANPTVTAASQKGSITLSSQMTALCSSGISNIGGEGCTISSYGFAVGTATGPTIGNTLTTGGATYQVGTTYTTKDVAFEKLITGLSASTKYYARAYATNDHGTGYGDEFSFTMPAACSAAPTVTAATTGTITSTTAAVNCSSGISVIGTGGCEIESYGFVYGTSSNPTTSNSTVEVGTTYTTTSTAFNASLTSLTEGTLYYVRPYATNTYGTDYGTQVSFGTPKITISETSRAFGDKAIGGSYTMTFTVEGSYLQSDISIAKSGTNQSLFSIDKSSVSQTSGTAAETTITVTYSPTTAGSHTATLTLTSTNATDKTVSLSGTGKWTVTFLDGDGEVHSTALVANGSAPSKPGSDPTTCDATSTTFMGWTQTKWNGKISQDDVDDLTTAATKVYFSGDDLPTMSDDMTYYPVFAKRSGSETEKTININTDTLTSYASVNKTIGGITFKSTGKYGKNTWSTYEYVQCENAKVLYNDDAIPGYIKSVKITPQSPAGVSNHVQLAVGTTKQPTSYSEDITTETTFGTYTSSNGYTYMAIYANGASALANIQIKYMKSSYTYSDYLTTCCDKNVTLATNSPANGTITFSPEGPIGTCGADAASRQTTMTVTPDAGYYLSAWSTTGVTPYSVSPSIAYGSVSNSGTQATTVTFTQNTTTGTYTANATFSAIPVSSLSLRAQQTGQSDKVGNDLTMNCYPKEGQTGGNDPLNHTLKVLFEEVLPANALDKTYDWSVRVKATGDADWTAVGFTGNALNTNSIIHTFNKSTGTLIIKATEGTAEIKITAHDGSGVTAKVTITVANVALSSLNVAKSSTTLYVGESEEIAVTYDPLNTTTKGYTTGSYTYVTIGRANDKITLTGKTTASEVTETVTLTSSDAGAKTATIDVTVKPLPTVTFLDIVHNKTDFTTDGDDLPASGIIASTASEGVVTHSKKTPTRAADVTDPGVGRNTCEREHLHLIGWIRSDYDKVEDYLNGTGSQLTITQIISAGNDGSGHAYFLAPDVSIDVRDYEGKTFYAVWAKIE